MNQLLLCAVTCAVFLAENEAARYRGCTVIGASCVSCSEVSMCTGLHRRPIVTTCEHPTPYCNNGRCTRSPDGSLCNSQFTGFTCPEEDGTYPEPSSAYRFHICINGVDTVHKCTVKAYWPPYDNYTSVYSDESRSCVRWYDPWGAHSLRTKCEGSNKYGTTSYYGNYRDKSYDGVKYKNYYFLCVNKKPTLVQRCQEGWLFNSDKQECEFHENKEEKKCPDYWEFNSDKRKCEPKCPTGDPRKDQRRFVDVEGDGRTFFECTYSSNNTAQSVQRTCPNGSIFDDGKMDCVRDTPLKLN